MGMDFMSPYNQLSKHKIWAKYDNFAFFIPTMHFKL
jgi:hypothetical protein